MSGSTEVRNQTKAVSGKARKRAVPSEKKMKESKKIREVSRNQARDSKNYYSVLENDDEEMDQMEVQAREQLTPEEYARREEFLRNANYTQKKVIFENPHYYARLHGLFREISAFDAFYRDFAQKELYGPFREAMDAARELRQNEDAYTLEQYRLEYESATERIRHRESLRFRTLREKEFRALTCSEACNVRHFLMHFGTYAQVDKFVRNLVDDYNNRYKGRPFDEEFEEFHRFDMELFLSPLSNEFFGNQSVKARKRRLRALRSQIKNAQDETAMMEAHFYNMEWIEEDTLECVAPLFEQPVMLSVQGGSVIDEDDPVCVADAALVDGYVIRPTPEVVDEESDPDYFDDWATMAEPLAPHGPALMSAFQDFLATTTGTVREYLVRSLDVVAALYNLSQASSKINFMTLLYSAVRTIFTDLSAEHVVSFGQALIGRLQVQAGEGEIWRSIANALGAMWDGAGNWLACPMIDVVLDMINVMSFSGFLSESTMSMLDDPKYRVFARSVKREVKGIPDLIGIVFRASMMAAEVVATYCENGVLDLTGWACGARKEVFTDHAALMSEKADASMGMLPSKRRGPHVRFNCPYQYQHCLNKTIDTCSTQMRRVHNLHEKNIYARMLKELMTVRNEISLSLRCAEARMKPFTFSVYGSTSSMKSTVALGVWKKVAMVNGMNYGPTNFCTVNFKDEYFSEVHQQEILLLDDFMNEKESSAQKVNPIRILLDWSSNNAVQLPGAAIDQKGNRYCLAKVLGLTCHDREFHAQTLSYQPEAAYRRVEVYIETILKPEFRKADDGSPNRHAINAIGQKGDIFPDIFYFNCWKCNVVGTGWEWVRIGAPLMNNTSMLAIVAEMSKEHFANQVEIVERLTNPAGWFCAHEEISGACPLCKKELLSTQCEVISTPELVTVESIRQSMRWAAGGIAEKILEILLAEMLTFKDMAKLRWRINYCAGETRIPVRDKNGPTGQYVIDFSNFIAMFRRQNLAEPDIPCSEISVEAMSEYYEEELSSDDSTPEPMPAIEDLEIQAQTFEMSPEVIYESITWDELDLLYPTLDRDELVDTHRRRLVQLFSTPSITAIVVPYEYHFECVFRIDKFKMEVQSAESDESGVQPLPGLEPAITVKADAIRAGVKEAFKAAVGTKGQGSHPFSAYRNRAIRDQLDFIESRQKTTVANARYSWFWWELFAGTKYLTLGLCALATVAPGIVSATSSTYTYSRNCSWTSLWRLPCAFTNALRCEFAGFGRYLQWGELVSDWFDNRWLPYNTRMAITIQKESAEGGIFGAAMAAVSARISPMSALEIWIGKPRAQLVKRSINVVGYISAAAAAYALYKSFAALKSVPFVGSAGNATVRKTWPTLKKMAMELPAEEMDAVIEKMLGEEFHIDDEHFYHVPKERMHELVVNSSEVDYPQKIPGEHKDNFVKIAIGKPHIGEQAKSTVPEVLLRFLESNLRMCSLTCVHNGKRKTINSHALAVGGYDWLLPTHVIKENVEDYTFQALCGPADTAGPHAKGTFCAKYVVPLPGVDYSLVRIPGSRTMTNLIPYFPLGECANVYAQLIHIVDGERKISNKRRMPLSSEQPVNAYGAPYKTMQVCMISDYPVATYQGLCGAVWMGGIEKKPFIHSLHICGVEEQRIGGSCILTQEMLTTAKSQLDQIVIGSASAGTFPLEVQSGKWTHELNSHHFLNYIPVVEDEVPIIDLVGTHEGHSGKYKQDIRDSLIASHLRAILDWPVAHKPVPHPNSTRHFQHAMGELAYPRNGFVASILDKAVEDLRDKIIRHVSDIPELFEMVRPLPDTAIVSGIDSMVGVNKMDPSTSAGFPERGKKGRFFVDGDVEAPVSVPMTMDDLHLRLAARMEKKLANGERVYAPFTLSVKIEPVKITKEYARLFGASNMVFTFVFRKYFLSIFRLIQLQPFHFETALGINCHSSDWDQMTHYLEHHDRLIEGDYQTYDKTMGAAIIMHAFSILIDIARLAGYTDTQLQIMRGIATEVAYPTYEARGVLFVAGGSNPSGHPGTFIINCLANSIFMRYAFFWSMKEQGVPLSLTFDKNFDDFVNLVTAGDDHLAGVAPECTWFDQHVVQKAMASVRVGYTDGKKNPVFECAFTKLEQASFVSRGFRWCTLLQRWVAPLAIKSLQKSYLIHNFSDNCPYTPAELIAIVVEQNEAELFFLGEEKFYYYYNAVREAMDSAGLSSWLLPVRTWEEVGEILKARTQPAFYPNLTTQAHEVENDEPPRKRLKTSVDNFLVGVCVNSKIAIHYENSYGEITRYRPGESPQPCIQGFKFTTTTGSLSRLHGFIGKILASQNNSNNGMTSSANVVHDNPSALTWSSSRGTMPDASREIYSGDADGLATYLERPILIAQMDWGIGVTLYQKYYPLSKYLTSVPIVRKLQNFQNITFELELDFEVSANPFLYGMLLVNWVPFPKYDALLQDRGLIFEDNVEASQRQRLFIDASSSSGGTMKIPFYWPTEYFNLVKDNPDDFGYVSIRQLNPLMHVSGANQIVTVYIRAKMTNIKLHTSTTQLVGSQPAMSVQAKDESPDDKLSSIATRVAGVAGSLKPALGGYAIATEQAANAAAGILRAMGLSHPRSKEMVHRFENRPLGNMSNYNVPSSAYTLGIDEHNEVTVDPSVACMAEDEMSLAFITGKETFIGTYDWDVTKQVGDVLATHFVHPYQYAKVTGAEEWHCSPMAFMSRMFTYWTGTIKFRFQIVCSKWHRGRLRIIHDPVLMGAVDATVWQTNLQSVVDITDERDFTIEVKYVQGQLWSATGPFRTAQPSYRVGSEYASVDLKDTNGVLKVVVMNRLVIPDDTVVAPCHINVFVSAGGDFELAVPKDDLSNMSISKPVVVSAQSITAAEPTAAFITSGNTGSLSFNPTLNRMAFTANVTPTAQPFGTPFYFTSGTVQTGVITVRNTGSSTVNLIANSNGTASITNVAPGATGDVIIRSSTATPTGASDLVYTLSHDGTGTVTFLIEAASLPVKPGFRFVSAVDQYRVLQRDGQQDAISNPTPPPTWPLYFNLAGAPTIYWRTTGSTGLYNPGNNNVPVYFLTQGPVRVNDGIYGPTRVAFNNFLPRMNSNLPDQGLGYSNSTFQLSADFAASTTVRGIVYDVMFMQPALVTQAEEVQDAEIGDPGEPPSQAVLHDVSTPSKYPFVYFGEKILHVRQILGRPQYHATYSLPSGAANFLRRHRIQETNIPEYPTAQADFISAWTPLYFIMACYNGWRGTFRSKYVINAAQGAMPTFARLERKNVGYNTRGQSYSEGDITTKLGVSLAITSNTSMWGGAIVTNPQLANEINVEFPYYYRYRFRAARPSQMGSRASSTDSHLLSVDQLGATGPAYVDRYFQPGDDFTLLNWMGTPVLY